MDAFQSDAFQDDAFQMEEEPVPPTPSSGGRRWRAIPAPVLPDESDEIVVLLI